MPRTFKPTVAPLLGMMMAAILFAVPANAGAGGAEDLDCPEGIVSYWKFDEGDGGTAVDSAGTKHGTIHGSAWTTGIVDGALYFDSYRDSVSLEATAVDLTIESWIKHDQGNARIPKGHVAGWHNGSTDGALFFGLDGEHPHVNYDTNTGGNHQVTYHGLTVSSNEWHHYALTKQGSNVKVYLDGVEIIDESNAAQALDIGSFGFRIGNENNRLAPFKGIIDEVALHYRALEPGEIRKHHDDGLQGLGYGEGMASYWKFDDGAGNTVLDSIGDNHGSLDGPEWTAGIVGGALRFDGQRDSVFVGAVKHIDVVDGIEFTVEAWIEHDQSTARIRFGHIAGWHNGGSDGALFFGLDLDNPHLNYDTITGGSHQETYHGLTVSSNEWHHYALTKQGSNVKVYLDGVEIISESDAAHDLDLEGFSFRIGDENNALAGFKGVIDEVAVHERALRAGEIERHHLSGLEGKNYCEVSPESAIQDLIRGVEEMDLPAGMENSLTSKLGNVLASLEKENHRAAANQLGAFINQVKAQQGKKLAEEESDLLLAAAEKLIDRLE